MPRLFIVGEAFQSFPGDDVGGEGDIAVNDFTGEVRKKVSGAWANLVLLIGRGVTVNTN